MPARLNVFYTSNDPCPLPSIPIRCVSPPPSQKSGRTAHLSDRLTSQSQFDPTKSKRLKFQQRELPHIQLPLLQVIPLP